MASWKDPWGSKEVAEPARVERPHSSVSDATDGDPSTPGASSNSAGFVRRDSAYATSISSEDHDEAYDSIKERNKNLDSLASVLHGDAVAEETDSNATVRTNRGTLDDHTLEDETPEIYLGGSDASTPRRMLFPVELDMPFTHATMPWDRYTSGRPNIPVSMFDSFLDYHQGQLDKVHDIGAGSGLGADALLNALRPRLPPGNATPPQLLLSDPGREALEVATRFIRARHPGAQFECWKARGEDQDQFVEEGSVDMAVCCESLHWMDIPPAVEQVWRSLRPGGTFAVVAYSVFPRIVNNAHAKRILRTFMNEHLQRRLRAVHEGSGDSDERLVNMSYAWQRCMRNLAQGLDCVELPESQWEDVRRVEINCGSTGWWWPPASKEILGYEASKVDCSPHEKIEYEDSESWGRVGGLNDIKELLNSIQVGFGEKDWESQRWKELEAAVKGPLHLVWQVHIALARKRA